MDSAVFRVDGSKLLGHGHIFRSLVLATELTRQGWQISFVSRDLDGAPISRMSDAGYRVDLLAPDMDEAEDSKASLKIAKEMDANWIVVDRYATDESSLVNWCENGMKTLAIDDVCQHSFPVDILVNQNLNAFDLPYQTRPDTVRLFGPRYALIRPQYRKARPPKPRKTDNIQRIMISMGGSDPKDATAKVIKALDRIDLDIEIDVIVGAGYPRYDHLVELSNSSPHPVSVFRDLPDLVEPMLRADLAITAGGSTVWELTCLGLPMLLIPTAPNQLDNAQAMLKSRMASAILRIDSLPDEQFVSQLSRYVEGNEFTFEDMAEAFKMVDGLGPTRIAEAILCNESNIRKR